MTQAFMAHVLVNIIYSQVTEQNFTLPEQRQKARNAARIKD